MTTFRLPLNTVHKEPIMNPSAPEYGIVPSTFLYQFSYLNHATSGGTTGSRIVGYIPAGTALLDLYVVCSSFLTGTTAATMTVTVGADTVLSNNALNTTNMIRAAGSTGTFGVTLNADTTVVMTFTTSAAASLGMITGGGGNVFAVVGVPFDASSRA